MILLVLNDLRSIDFVVSFPQADLDVLIFMEFPAGFYCENSHQYVLRRLNKNLYKLKNASLNFFNMLKEGLEAQGYTR